MKSQGKQKVRQKMGMTIDKTIEFFNGLECHTPQAKEAREVVIDTMRKYQKIEQIIHDDWIKGVNSGATLNKIEEVLEDGNVN